jgi:competence protein ComEA
MMNRSLLARLLVLALVSGVVAPLAAQENPSSASRAAVSASGLVNLNTASASELATLPGIGPRTAQLIVEHREKNGGFKKIEELMHIRGIGEKSFLRLRDLVTVGEKTPAARQ